MDETGLYFCMAPNRTIACEQIEGVKKDKARFTVGLTANAGGSGKLQPFIIGHAAKPRCFQKRLGTQLGFCYRNNSKAWMTGLLFREWLQELESKMMLLNRQKRVCRK